MKKNVILICIACVIMIGEVAALVAYDGADRELKQQAWTTETTLNYSIILLADSLEDTETSSDYIAGLAASFCTFSTLDAGNGLFSKISDVISPLENPEVINTMTAAERTQTASVLKQLMDTSGTEAQLELLRQLNFLLK